ncbi:ABC transporter permease/substrate-binding protein [Methylocaldum szegediense]|uniref:Osmoprotectant transport system substrate-binding protein n=1 Tax=Methylocaldum szegediense TaxID=73780 RepID=A0ABN8X024_9GAMM|nr:glycine betaine ABC transporter substrate-binding protein [Methylocaldum szegediense]CAI8735773.1 osmoprotectant transport system substrate-binding protein [Methylocaldum szegediense]
MIRTTVLLLGLWLGCGPTPAAEKTAGLIVGSKPFTESVILGEIATQILRSQGIEVQHRDQLGGTRLIWQALRNGEIDLYPEYTGTLMEEILADRLRDRRDLAALRQALAEQGIRMSEPLGFNNTYALGMTAGHAGRLGIATISGLRRHPELKFGFSNEFMGRADGWPGLRQAYGLPQHAVVGMDHDLAYRGLVSGSLDVTDLYTTDPEIRYYSLRVLEDDRGYFPDYHAVYLYRADLAARQPDLPPALRQLEGQISEATMVAMNAEAKLDKVPESRVAAGFLEKRFGIKAAPRQTSLGTSLWRHTVEHLTLVAISLTAAILTAVPLGILCVRRPRLGRLVIGATGILQTIPSLALLVFMIPLLGIGTRPAIAALFLYSLLPIVRNTCTGLADIPPSLLESADALGLSRSARLRLVELPLASRTILAGIKTAAVINVGMATLGALIGAGGYDQLILTGIRLDDTGLILQGAIPAALLALAIESAFGFAERWLVPKGLRL